jgi:hypothetical protein
VLTAFMQYGYSQAKLENARTQIANAKTLVEAYEIKINALEEQKTTQDGRRAKLLAGLSVAKDLIEEAKAFKSESGACKEETAPLDDFEKRLDALDVRIDAAAHELTQFDEKAGAVPVVSKKIFLHIADERDRKTAGDVEETLKKYGHIVPGIQNVSGKAKIPRDIEVRYFRFPQDQEIAREILNLVQQHHDAKDARLVYVGRDPAAIRSGHIEVWFPGRSGGGATDSVRLTPR